MPALKDADTGEHVEIVDAEIVDDGIFEQPPPRTEPQALPAEKPKARRGRPAKAERSRTAEAPPVAPSPEVTAKRAASAEEAFRAAATGLLVVGKVAHMPSFSADGYVINANAAGLGTALAEVAVYEPQVAKFLDKAPSGKLSAWLGLATVVAGLGLQAAANHKIIRPGSMGTADPAEIIRANEEAAAAQQRADEERADEEYAAAMAESMTEKEHADAG